MVDLPTAPEDDVEAESLSSPVAEKWPSPLPPKRGDQKKRALAEAENQEVPLSSRKLPGHAELGYLKLTLGSKKSYVTCTEPREGFPKLVVEFTEHQSPQHQALMAALFKEAADHLLDRVQIKALKVAVLERVRSST